LSAATIISSTITVFVDLKKIAVFFQVRVTFFSQWSIIVETPKAATGLQGSHFDLLLNNIFTYFTFYIGSNCAISKADIKKGKVKMIKQILMVAGAALFLSPANAQQERQVSHYMFDQITTNPGSAGSTDMISTHAIYRSQWTGIDGAPEGITLNLSAPFRLFKADHGIGFSVWQDRFGFNSDVRPSLSYAYQFNLGSGKLGVGLSAIFMSRSLSPDWVLPSSPLHSDVDEAIPNGDQNETIFDMGFGLYYRTDELYVGVSSTHLLEDVFIYETTGSASRSEEKLKRQYYLTAGYTFQLANPALELQPSMLIHSDISVTKLELNTLLVYNKKFWGGVSYRVGSEVIGMVGIEILNGVKIGYAYDFNTTALSNFSSGSHEVMIGYDFRIGVEKIPQKYKSIRFL